MKDNYGSLASTIAADTHLIARFYEWPNEMHPRIRNNLNFSMTKKFPGISHERSKMPVVSLKFLCEVLKYLCCKSTSFTYLRLTGCVRYVLASLFFKSKREHLRNLEKWFLFHFKSSFHSRENQILEFWIS